MDLTHLGSEERYIWERLFSAKEDTSRNKLKKDLGEGYSTGVKGLDAKIKVVRQFAERMRQLAVEKGAEAVNTLEYEDLLLQAKWEAGLPGYSFLQVIYFDALSNLPKKEVTVSREDREVISRFLSKIQLPDSEEDDQEAENTDAVSNAAPSEAEAIQEEKQSNEGDVKPDSTPMVVSKPVEPSETPSLHPAKPSVTRSVTTKPSQPSPRSCYGNLKLRYEDRAVQRQSYRPSVQEHPGVNQPSLPRPISPTWNRKALQVLPRHKNSIACLNPSNCWNLYIDESYRDSQAGDTSFTTGGNGIIAGVLSDANFMLPGQPQLHAAKDYKEDELVAGDKLIETILNQKQCGVLALPVHSMESTQSWADCIITFLGVVLRMLPMPKKQNKVQVKVWIEQRCEYSTDKDLRTINDVCLHELGVSYPDRLKRLEVSLHIMNKTDPFNAYPDFVAYTCMMRNGYSYVKKRFQATQWDGVCFLNYPVDTLKGLWDCLKLGRELPPETWSELLLTPESKKGIVEFILNAIGSEARGDLALWEKYLQETIKHLNSHSLNLYRLQGQLDWLKRFAPISEELTPKVKLLWLTSKLAQANHLGQILNEENPTIVEFYKLSESLFFEEAAIVCYAHLHLAVAMTNAFQFGEAQKIVRNYLRLAGCGDDPEALSPAIPGLRYYGQLLSTCGQHEAFLGNLEVAKEYFRHAVTCFEKLSENREGDIKQTQAYLVTVLMDLVPNEQETREAMEEYLGSSLEKAASELALSNDDSCKYQHHILLRYLALGNARDALQSYLDKEQQWQSGEGHPWEMIEFYRGLLLQEKQGHYKHFEKAYELAKDGGPTIKVIAAVILGSILLENPLVKQEYQSLVQEVIAALPALGARGHILEEQPEKRLSPLELAQAVLPFNFR